MLESCGPPHFWHQGQVSRKTIFPLTREERDGFRMIQVHYIYCALYFYYYCISSTSDHEALYPGGWGCLLQSHSVSSVAQSCLILCDPMDCSTPGLPVYHQLPEPTQTHVHRVSDAIQPSHPLSHALEQWFSKCGSQYNGLGGHIVQVSPALHFG